MGTLQSPAEQLRDRLIALAVEPLVELDALGKDDGAAEIANARGRYEAAKAAVVAWMATFGNVAEFQAENVAEAIIQYAYSNA